MTKDAANIPVNRIEKAIYLIRGEKVILDRDLAELYEVQTKVLNQSVRRNRDRFPSDFMFQLTREEAIELNRSQFVTGSQKHRDPRFRPDTDLNDVMGFIEYLHSSGNFPDKLDLLDKR